MTTKKKSALAANRSIARRSDLFTKAAAKNDAEAVLEYRSGRQNGPVYLEHRTGKPLDHHALAAMIVVADRYRRGKVKNVKHGAYTIQVTVVRARTLCKAIFGRDDGTAYRAMWKALDALSSCVIRAGSAWTDSRGKEWVTEENIHPLPIYRRNKGVAGERWEWLVIGLDGALAEELKKAVTWIPPEILQLLTRNPSAGRLAAHMLSHRPMQLTDGTKAREIGAETLEPVVEPSEKMTIKGGGVRRYKEYIKRTIKACDEADPNHQWEYIDEGPGKPGKVRVIDI